jgi:hypothetical protein
MLYSLRPSWLSSRLHQDGSNSELLAGFLVQSASLRALFLLNRLGRDELLFVIVDRWCRRSGHRRVDEACRAALHCRSAGCGIAFFGFGFGNEAFVATRHVVARDHAVCNDRRILDSEWLVAWEVITGASGVTDLLAQDGRVQVFGM